VCRAAQALPVRPLDALRRRTHLSGGRADSVHIARHDTDGAVLSCLVGVVNWAYRHKQTRTHTRQSQTPPPTEAGLQTRRSLVTRFTKTNSAKCSPSLFCCEQIASSVVTLTMLQPQNRSFQYASPRLWNQLPAPLRQPRTNLSNSASPSCMSGNSSIGSIDSPLSSSITPSLFHSRLKTFLFCKSFPP